MILPELVIINKNSKFAEEIKVESAIVSESSAKKNIGE